MTGGSQQEVTTTNDSKLVPKPVPRRRKLPAGLKEMILRQQAVKHKSDTAAIIGQEMSTTTSDKPPLPAFRKKTPAVVPSRPGSETTEKQPPVSSELTAAFGKIHRRAKSSGNTDTLQLDNSEPAEVTLKETVIEKPSARTTAVQQIEKTESAENISKERPVEKPTTMKKSELAIKLSRKADASQAEKPQREVEKPEEKLSITTEVGQQTASSDDVEVKRRASQRLKPPAKTGIVTDKAEGAAKSSPSRVVKAALNEPASTAAGSVDILSNQKHVETNVEDDDEESNRFQVLGVPKVRLKSTLPTLNVSAALSSQTTRSDSALNVVGLDAAPAEKEDRQASVSMKKEHLLETYDQLDSKPSKTGGVSLVATKSFAGSTSLAEKRAGLKTAVTNTKSDSNSCVAEKEPSKLSSETTVISKSSGFCSKAASDRITVSKTEQLETAKHSAESVSKSEQTDVKTEPSTVPANSKAASSARQAGFMVSKAAWEQKSSSGSTAEFTKTQSSEQSQTSADKAPISESGGSFVPVSKRATIFGSSVGHGHSNSTADSSRTEVVVKTTSSRQYVGKAGGYTVNTAIPLVNSDTSSASSEASAGSSKTVSAGTSSIEAQSVSSTKDTTVTQMKIKSVPSSTEFVQATCEARNEVVIKAAAIGHFAPDSKSSDISSDKPFVTILPKKQTKDSSKETSSPSEREKAATSSVLSRVKSYAASSQKNQPKDSSEETSTAEPVKVSTSSKAVAQKSVSFGVKPSGSLLSKDQPKDSSEEMSNAAEQEKVASGSGAVAQKSVLSLVKPSETFSSKNWPKDSSEETLSKTEPEKVSISSHSTLTEKSTISNTSAVTAGPKTTTSRANVETTPTSLPKVTSANTEAPMTTSSVIGLAPVKSSDAVVRPKRNFGSSNANSEPQVTSTEPPWMAIARQKTRVWTEGKM